MSELPFDLLEEILIRVPVNDILRFRCVCKTWRLLFQGERFIRTHTAFAPTMLFVSGLNPRNSYVYEHVDKSSKTTNMLVQDSDLTLNDHSDKQFFVAGHCNGLFCLVFDDVVVVWNPSLRELRTIPTLTNEHFYISSHVGFWYDHSIKDYKILLIPCLQLYELWRGSYNKFKRQAEILTLKSSPRKIDFHTDKHLYDHGWLSRRGTLVGGYMFWYLVYELGETDETIFSFDIVSETFSYSSSPCSVDNQHLFLTTLRGRLCLVQHLHAYSNGRSNFTETNVWCANHEELDMGRIKSWRKLFRMDLTDIKRSIHCGVVYDVFLGTVTKAGEFLIRLRCEYPYNFKVFAYNFEKNEFREVKELLDANANGDELVSEYEATLVPTLVSRFQSSS